MAATRAFLRREIGNITGTVTPWTATSAGTQTTLIDVINGAVENNALAGDLGWVASGPTTANLYTTVRITANSKSATSITFVPALTSNTAVGDVIEVYNSDDGGPTIDQIHRAINRVIESVSFAGLTEVLDTSSTFDADAPTLAVPVGWRRVIGVEWEDDEGFWHDVPPADLMPDPVSRTMRVDNYPRWLANTNSVRLRGYTAASGLNSDTATTTVDAEFIINEAAGQLFLANQQSYPDPAAARAMGQFYASKADTRRPKALKPLRSRGWVF